MSLQDLPLEVVIDFVFPFLTDGELVHLRILSHQFAEILQRNIKTFTLSAARVSNKVLLHSNQESLFRLLTKLINVEYVNGIRQIFDHETIYQIIQYLPRLKNCEEFLYMSMPKMAMICPEFEIVDFWFTLETKDEAFAWINVDRFKIGIVSSPYTENFERFSQVFKKFHFIEEIRFEVPDVSPFVWNLIQEERNFRINHNKKLALEKSTTDRYYPETIRFKICYELITLDFLPMKDFPIILETSSVSVLNELAPYGERAEFKGNIRHLCEFLSNERCILKELDLSASNYDWIVPRNTSVSVQIREDEKLEALKMELYRKVIIQLLNRLKSLQVLKLSLPFNILLLFGNELKPNMSHYNLEKHASLDWIPLNYYASVQNYGTRPQLILKRRKSSPLYKEPTEYEKIDFSVLDPPPPVAKKEVVFVHQPTGLGLFDEFW